MKFPLLSQEKGKLVGIFTSEHNVAEEDIRWIASPYRISPLGAHIDHQGGPVLGMTIDAYTLLAYVPTSNGRVGLRSLNYPGRVEFNLLHPEENTGSPWGIYARGAALAIGDAFEVENGIEGLILGHLPGGGLSSSASVLLAYLTALADANGIQIDPWELVRMTRVAENTHIGLKNGILDQTSIAFGKAGHLLHIDTIKPSVSFIEQTQRPDPYRILIAYSGYSRELTSTGYNSRVAECCEAAEQLSELAGRRPATRLGDVPIDVFRAHGKNLPSHLYKRAAHFFSEMERVEKGIAAWAKGDMQTFGHHMLKSCHSSIVDYECGSPAIHDLQQIVSQTEGVFGSRFNGGGFGGCVVGIVAADAAKEATTQIRKAYIARYPEVADEARVYLANSVAGLGRL
jgi:galactokinase/galacturonokinase